MASFDTLTTAFNHQISKLVIGVKNTSIKGDDKSEEKAEDQINRFDC